jgi:hypothetical protein
MGPLSNARLTKHVISAGECEDIGAAKEFLKRYCFARWIEQEGFRERGAIEEYATGQEEKIWAARGA